MNAYNFITDFNAAATGNQTPDKAAHLRPNDPDFDPNALQGQLMGDPSKIAAGDSTAFTEQQKLSVLEANKKEKKERATWQEILRQVNERIDANFKAIAKLINEMYEGANAALNTFEQADQLLKEYKRYQAKVAEEIKQKDFELNSDGTTNKSGVNKYLEDYQKRNPNAAKPKTMDDVLEIIKLQSLYVNDHILPELERISDKSTNLHDRWINRAKGAEQQQKANKTEWEQIQEIKDPEEKAKALENFDAKQKSQKAEETRLNTQDNKIQTTLDERFTQISKNATVAEPHNQEKMAFNENKSFGFGIATSSTPSP